MSSDGQPTILSSFNDCKHTMENRSVLEEKANHQANDNQSDFIQPSDLMNKDETCRKNISVGPASIEGNPEFSSLDMEPDSIKDNIDKPYIKSSSSGISSISTSCSVHSQQPSKQNGNSTHCPYHRSDDCSQMATSKFSSNHNGLKQKSKYICNNSEQFLSCRVNEDNCLKCSYLEIEVAQLKEALDDSKKKNKKLKSQLEALQNDLGTLKHSRNYSKRKHIYPGLIIDIIGEIYAAQRERDEAIMSRIHLANDERDIALDQLEEFKEKYYKLTSVQRSHNKTFIDAFQRKTNYLDKAEEILKNKHLILDQVSSARQKDKKEDLDSSRPNVTKVEETKEWKSETPLSSPLNLVKVRYSLEEYENKILAESTQIGLLQQRLLDEMGARQQAEENCQKLEKLVSVLKRKVNGLILGHPLMTSSVDSFPSSPSVALSAEAILPEPSTPVSAKITPDSSWEDRTVSYA